MQERLIEDSKPQRDEDQDGRLDQLIKLKHYCTMYALSTTRTKILKFFRNWIIILFIIEYFMQFLLYWCILRQKFYKSWDFYKYLVILRQSWKNVKSLEMSRKFLKSGIFKMKNLIFFQFFDFQTPLSYIVKSQIGNTNTLHSNSVTQSHVNLILHKWHKKQAIHYGFYSCCFHNISVLPFRAAQNVSVLLACSHISTIFQHLLNFPESCVTLYV